MPSTQRPFGEAQDTNYSCFPQRTQQSSESLSSVFPGRGILLTCSYWDEIFIEKKKKSSPSPFSLFPNPGCHSSTLCPRVISPSQEALVSGSAGIDPPFLCVALSLKGETGLRNCSWRMMLECSDGAQNLDRTLITSLLIYFHSQTGPDWGLQAREH